MSRNLLQRAALFKATIDLMEQVEAELDEQFAINDEDDILVTKIIAHAIRLCSGYEDLPHVQAELDRLEGL